MSFKIGMVHYDLPEEGKKPGGVFVAVHELANALVRTGNYVRFYSHTAKPSDALYELVSLPRLTKSNRINRRLVLPFQIGGLDLKDLDILHLHGDDWGFLNRSIPTIRTFHGCAINESKFADNLKAKLVHAAYHPLELWGNKLASCSVGVGDDTIKLLGAKYVIPNGYDAKLFYPEQKSDVPTAIVVGSLAGRKRAKLAIELLLSLLDEIPNLQIHAVIDRPYEHPSVHNWIGVSKQQLAKLVRESWIGLSTTLYEGFGIYYLEWMAAGTVPITLDNIGTKSLICNSQAGIVVENLSELKAAALNVLKDPNLRTRYSSNALTAAKGLTWENIAHQYTEVYAEAISNFKGSYLKVA